MTLVLTSCHVSPEISSEGEDLIKVVSARRMFLREQDNRGSCCKVSTLSVNLITLNNFKALFCIIDY